MVEKKIITKFESRHDFLKLLEMNPGLIIVKLGAEWCGPCQKIVAPLHAFFASSPENVVCADIDVDESFDFYAYLKSKKMVNGIPHLMCYKKGNTSYIPDDSVTGADLRALDAFFRRCGDLLLTVPLKKVIKNQDTKKNTNTDKEIQNLDK